MLVIPFHLPRGDSASPTQPTSLYWDTCTFPCREGKSWTTRQSSPDSSTSWSRDTTPPYPKSVLWSVLLLHVHDTCTCASSCIHLSPESWSVNLVSSWLINQLAQGKDSTVKVYKGQNKHTYTTGHWWFIRYKKICCYYTSYHIILLIKIIHFIIYDDEISHFPHLYHIQILQKHQITPFLYSVKKSLFLTFYHISVIFYRSIIFIIFLHLPKITIFHKITKNHHFPINDHFPGNTKNTQIC